MRIIPLGLGLALGVLAAGTVFAADLVVERSVMAPVADDSWHPYVKLFGGATVPNTLTFNGTDYDLDAGWLLGGAIGFGAVDGLSFELDGTYSDAGYSGFPNDLLGATFMGNVVLTGALSDQVAVYGGVGLGAVGLQYDQDPDSDWGYGAGGQVFAGVSFDVADNVSIFGEARYQAAFDTIEVDHAGHVDDLGFARTSLLAGVKFGW